MKSLLYIHFFLTTFLIYILTIIFPNLPSTSLPLASFLFSPLSILYPSLIPPFSDSSSPSLNPAFYCLTFIVIVFSSPYLYHFPLVILLPSLYALHQFSDTSLPFPLTPSSSSSSFHHFALFLFNHLYFLSWFHLYLLFLLHYFFSLLFHHLPIFFLPSRVVLPFLLISVHV